MIAYLPEVPSIFRAALTMYNSAAICAVSYQVSAKRVNECVVACSEFCVCNIYTSLMDAMAIVKNFDRQKRFVPKGPQPKSIAS